MFYMQLKPFKWYSVQMTSHQSDHLSVLDEKDGRVRQ